METTLTIDDELAAQLQAAARERGLPFDKVVNQVANAALRQLVQHAQPIPPQPYRTEPHDFGTPPDFSFDKVWDLLAEEEAEHYRKSQPRP